ncbi:hypothetical protein [Neobacillus jeddahensis]|uniref:hypothetical protein n=1 Tax=Neobacillus jeddahensis TaxID=1461580 RepID=UPI00058C9C8F|nr:hypothetical protein [Neobacillus jeddahensis]
MSLVTFSSISLLAIIYFVVMPKNLNTLELTMIIILVVYLDSNFMDISMLNLGTFKLTEKHHDQLTFYLTFTVLYPLFIATSLNLLRSFRFNFIKILIPFITISIIVGFDELIRHLAVIEYKNWNWPADFLQWLIIWMICYFTHILFRKLVMKELKQ